MTDALRPVRALASAGPGVLLLHHPRKGSALGGQGARGAGALPAFVDVLVEMQRAGPGGGGEPPAAAGGVVAARGDAAAGAGGAVGRRDRLRGGGGCCP